MLAGGAAATRAPEPRGHSRACSQEFPTLITAAATGRKQGARGGWFPSQSEPTNKEKKKEI